MAFEFKSGSASQADPGSGFSDFGGASSFGAQQSAGQSGGFDFGAQQSAGQSGGFRLNQNSAGGFSNDLSAGLLQDGSGTPNTTTVWKKTRRPKKPRQPISLPSSLWKWLLIAAVVVVAVVLLVTFREEITEFLIQILSWVIILLICFLIVKAILRRIFR